MKFPTILCTLSLLTDAHLITGVIDRKTTPIDFSQLSITLNDGEFSSLVDVHGAFTIAVPDYAASYKL